MESKLFGWRRNDFRCRLCSMFFPFWWIATEQRYKAKEGRIFYILEKWKSQNYKEQSYTNTIFWNRWHSKLELEKCQAKFTRLGLYNKLPYRKLPSNLSFFAFFRKLDALGLNIFNKTSSVVYNVFPDLQNKNIWLCLCCRCDLASWRINVSMYKLPGFIYVATSTTKY